MHPPKTQRRLPGVLVLAFTAACAPERPDAEVPDAGPPPEPPLFVVSTYPGSSATDVPNDLVISAVFSEPLDPLSIDPATFDVTENGSQVPGAVNVNGKTLTFTPSRRLTESASVLVTIHTLPRSINDRRLVDPYSWSFQVAAQPQLSLEQACKETFRITCKAAFRCTPEIAANHPDTYGHSIRECQERFESRTDCSTWNPCGEPDRPVLSHDALVQCLTELDQRTCAELTSDAPPVCAQVCTP